MCTKQGITAYECQLALSFYVLACEEVASTNHGRTSGQSLSLSSPSVSHGFQIECYSVPKEKFWSYRALLCKDSSPPGFLPLLSLRGSGSELDLARKVAEGLGELLSKNAFAKMR